jgi:hypothetical protein
MTIFDDPNREAVGLDPIWTDAEDPPLPDPPAATTAKATPPAPVKATADDEGKATRNE